MAKKAPNPQTLSSKIDIALRLRPFVTSQVRLSAFLQSYSPSNYRKLKTRDRHQKSMLVSDVVYNGGRTIGRAMLQANHRDDDSYPTLLSVKSPVSDGLGAISATFSHSDKMMP